MENLSINSNINMMKEVLIGRGEKKAMNLLPMR